MLALPAVPSVLVGHETTRVTGAAADPAVVRPASGRLRQRRVLGGGAPARGHRCRRRPHRAEAADTGASPPHGALQHIRTGPGRRFLPHSPWPLGGPVAGTRL